MTTLEKYLREEYPFDLRDVGDVEKLLASVVHVYRMGFTPEKAWAYEIRDGKPVPIDSLSENTTAMILDALFRFGGFFEAADKNTNVTRAPKGGVFPLEKAAETFAAKSHTQALSLKGEVMDAESHLRKKIAPSGATVATNSRTYGANDIFTLAWLAEISSADWGKLDKALEIPWTKIAADVRGLALAKARSWAVEHSPRTLFDPSTAKDAPIGPNRSEPQAHAFSMLRLVQTLRRVEGAQAPVNSGGRSDDVAGAKKDDEIGPNQQGTKPELSLQQCLQRCYAYFEKLLHEQLSFSSIPDSRFDPAELMFCLEGMLICQRNTVDRTIFDRVLSVLTAAQNESAYWRPVKPFLTTAQGLALFPVSVEIANSLMRACALFDADQLHETYGSRCIGLLRRYWQWLRARAVRLPGDSGNEDKVGWHSEHVNEPGVIHLWETSQVMEFILSYRSALQQHIARTTLVLSRFTQTLPKNRTWDETKASYEPITPGSGIGDALSVYSRIYDDFIEPHQTSASDRNYSMLLYGPPGTGKTTIAEGIANALKRRLITITVSDFLAGGSAQVETRAKDIFTVLMAQPDCVVLFDEIDHFLLDRDSARYSKQDTVFQFMTPGMLTKLNDLRRTQRSLFVVATNYEDRIDAAIKRTGRIDKKYLVLPPDAQKRMSYIKQWIGEEVMADKTRQDKIFPEKVTEEEWVLLQRASLYLGYKDIEGAVKSTRQKSKTTMPTVTSLAQELERRARTTSLEAYQSRFTNEGAVLDSRETPIREFLCLLGMSCEVDFKKLNLVLPKIVLDPDVAVSTASTKDSSGTNVDLTSAEASAVRKAVAVLSDQLKEEGAAKVVERNAPELRDLSRAEVAAIIHAIYSSSAEVDKDSLSKNDIRNELLEFFSDLSALKSVSDKKGM